MDVPNVTALMFGRCDGPPSTRDAGSGRRAALLTTHKGTSVEF